MVDIDVVAGGIVHGAPNPDFSPNV